MGGTLFKVLQSQRAEIYMHSKLEWHSVVIDKSFRIVCWVTFH